MRRSGWQVNIVGPGMTPQHHIIKETSESISRLLQDEFKRNGYKRVHIVEQAPKPDAIEGKPPSAAALPFSPARLEAGATCPVAS